MKFVYFSDTNIEPVKVFSDFDGNSITIVSSVDAILQLKDQGSIILAVLEKAPSAEFLEWKKNNSELKLVLFSVSFTEAYLRDLQLEFSFYDLFFRYPISFFEVEKNIRLISPYSNSSFNVGAQDLSVPKSSKVELSVEEDNTGTFLLGLLSEAVPAPEVETPKVDELKMSDAVEASSSEAISAGLSESEEPNEPTALSFNNSSEVETLPVDEELIASTPEEDKSLDLVELEEPVETLEMNEAPQLPQEEISVEPEVLHEKPMPEMSLQQGVSLNEILESKEDQIFRLLSQNNRLKEELFEKEELIKTIQKDLHEQQGSFEKNKSDIDDTKFQLSVIQSSHEKEKSDIQRNLENALGKIILLEQRLEEVKKEYQKNSQSQLSTAELRKIKGRQEHLEEKISLLQSDSAMQLQNREKKIIELKRKIDLLEFDLKDSQEREKDFKKKIHQAESKLAQMKQVLKQVVDDSVMIDVDPLKKTGSYDI